MNLLGTADMQCRGMHYINARKPHFANDKLEREKIVLWIAPFDLDWKNFTKSKLIGGSLDMGSSCHVTFG